VIYLNIDKSGIDAMIMKKDVAVQAFAKTYGVSLGRIAVIGDGNQDIAFLATPGVGLVGCPANAKQKVREYVQSVGGYVANGCCLDGFFEFKDLAKEKGIEVIISDKDGVLVDAGNLGRADEFRSKMIETRGSSSLTILTGSAVEQNLRFLAAYGLDERLKQDSGAMPYVLLAENGAIHMHAWDRSKDLNYVERIDQELLAVLKGQFEATVRSRIEQEVLPCFNFSWSRQYNDQDCKVYVPRKESMVTVNVPRSDGMGEGFRSTQRAESFRWKVYEIMEQVAEDIGIETELL
jgi:3-deoxy-D-manno-octulosonate 8-phosphate phosphatase KdsC-like HAD superfamily phosphatase